MATTAKCASIAGSPAIGIDVIAAENAARHSAALRRTARSSRTSVSRSAASTSGAARASRTCSTRTTVFKLQHATRAAPVRDLPASTRSWSTTSPRSLMTLRGLFALRPAAAAGADRGGRAGLGDRQAVRHRRDVLRLDLDGGAPDPGHRDEPPRRPSRTPVRAARTPSVLRRPGDSRARAIKQVASGRLRRDARVPGQRRRHPDQDGAGRQARRGRPAARPQGLPVDRQDPALARRASA